MKPFFIATLCPLVPLLVIIVERDVEILVLVVAQLRTVHLIYSWRILKHL